MKIVEKREIIRYTVEKDQWDLLESKYGVHRAAEFLMTEGEFVDAEPDAFGVYMYITFHKESTPSITSMSSYQPITRKRS